MADLNNLLASLEESEDVQRTDDEEIDLNISDAERQLGVNLPPVQAEVGQQDGTDYEEDRDGERSYGDYDNGVNRPDVDDFDENPESGADAEYEQLKMLWSSELACPELLPHDAETVALHVELLRGQEETIDDLSEQSELSSLAASIYKMEADRVRFILSDLSRTRLAKVENHALHNRELADRMTDEEVHYLQQYGALLERHLQRTVLNHLPKDAWKKLDEPGMIDMPDFNEFVFCRVTETVEIDNDMRGNNEEGEDEEDEYERGIQEHSAGSCLIARYGSVRELILQGKVLLLM
mmetsp:Transcript_28675/g.42213  ORF Transcript_28675/g.42213 Transcript_28675/m.42213 type:complete len:295 (-) Transcript_28675:236-1120(-)